MADIEFECPHCNHMLAVDERGAGLEVNCPECEKPVTIPEPPDDSSSVEVAGRSCPSCKAAMADRAVICVKCGFDLQTWGHAEVSGKDNSHAEAVKRLVHKILYVSPSGYQLLKVFDVLCLFGFLLWLSFILEAPRVSVAFLCLLPAAGLFLSYAMKQKYVSAKCATEKEAKRCSKIKEPCKTVSSPESSEEIISPLDASMAESVAESVAPPQSKADAVELEDATSEPQLEILATCPKCGRDDVPFVCPNCEKSTGEMRLKEGRVECFCGIETDRITCPDCGATIVSKWFRRNPAKDESAQQASLKPRKNTAKLCPNCNTPLTDDAVLCVQCGWNLQTGKRIHRAEPSFRRAQMAGNNRSSTAPVLFAVLVLGFLLVVGIVITNHLSSKRTRVANERAKSQAAKDKQDKHDRDFERFCQANTELTRLRSRSSNAHNLWINNPFNQRITYEYKNSIVDYRAKAIEVRDLAIALGNEHWHVYENMRLDCEKTLEIFR